MADLSFKETKLSLGLLGVDQSIQRRRLALGRDVVPAYADTSKKRPERRGMNPKDKIIEVNVVFRLSKASFGVWGRGLR